MHPVLLRDYQSAAANYLAARQRALVICPAGGGKTVIGAAALAQVQMASPCVRIGWACNTREQVQQGEAALTRAGVRAAWVRCVPGVSKEMAEDVDVLVIDECHHLTAASWSAMASACRGRIWGLTATPLTGDEARDNAFRAFWGGRAHVVKREKVMEGGHLASGEVRIIRLDTRGEFDGALVAAAEAEVAAALRRWPGMRHRKDWVDDQRSRALWRSTQDHLQTNERRNAEVVRLACAEIERGQSVLILVTQIEHGERLAARIPGAVMAHSGIGTRKRREVIEGMRSGEVRCMVATSLADEGLDVPRASVLILACGGRSAAKLEQRTGRVMRPSEAKAVGLVYDFADDGAAMARAQHTARLKVYSRLGYRVMA